jgi:hypothetical protein
MSRDQGSSTTETTQTDFTTIQTWLEEADYILIAAGAGRVDSRPFYLASFLDLSNRNECSSWLRLHRL